MIQRLVIFGVILCLVGAIILAENATRLPADRRQWRLASGAEDVSITARDGVILRGACFKPATATPRGAILVLHGVGDRGYSMSGFAELMTAHGYIVLTADSRAHGGSGGGRITYGLLERYDVTTWLDWLDARFHPPAFYGYGASLGGGILLQSLAVEPRFKALIAECPFADFHTVAYDRLAGLFSVPRFLFAPLVEPAFAYTRLRYGYNLYAASPIEALRKAHTPTLLIHGVEDINIPIEHSRRLHAANPANTELWEVPRAAHVAAWSTAGGVYENRVVDWFAAH